MKQKVVTFGEIMLRLAPEGIIALYKPILLVQLMVVEKPMLRFL